MPLWFKYVLFVLPSSSQAHLLWKITWQSATSRVGLAEVPRGGEHGGTHHCCAAWNLSSVGLCHHFLHFASPTGPPCHQGEFPSSLGMQKPHPIDRADSSWQFQNGHCFTHSHYSWHLPSTSSWCWEARQSRAVATAGRGVIFWSDNVAQQSVTFPFDLLSGW